MRNAFKTESNKSIEKLIPSKVFKRRNGLPYVDKETRRLMEKRDKLHAKKNPRHCKIKHFVRKKMRETYWKYVDMMLSPQQVLLTQTRQPNAFGRYSNTLELTTVAFRPWGIKVYLWLMQLLKLPCWTGYYILHFPLPLPNDLNSLRSSYPKMPDIHVNTSVIVSLLKDLKPLKAAQPDALKPEVLMELAPSIAPILQIIFTKSLQSHQVLDDSKLVQITPVYKKEDPSALQLIVLYHSTAFAAN